MDEIDAAVYGLVEETLCQTAVLRSILSSIIEHQPPQEDGRAAAQRGVERLEKRRVRVLDMYEHGDVDRGDYIKRLGDVDRVLSSARAAAAQAPPPIMDTHALARFGRHFRAVLFLDCRRKVGTASPRGPRHHP